MNKSIPLNCCPAVPKELASLALEYGHDVKDPGCFFISCIPFLQLHFNDLALDCPLCEAKTSCLSGLDSLPATDQQALLIEHKQMDTK